MVDFNFLDLIVLLFFIYFLWQGFHIGFIGGVFNIITTALSFVAAIVFYPQLGSLIASQSNLGENLSFVIAFFAILVILEIILSFLFTRVYILLKPFYKRFSKIIVYDKVLGMIPSVLVGIFLVTLFLLIPLILPIRDSIRKPIQESWWGRNVLSEVIKYQPQFESVLSRLPYKNLAFLITPQPLSRESVELNLPKEIKLNPDPENERAMFDLVNQERLNNGLASLNWDDELMEVGRKHCLDMFSRGYFSHYTPEGASPFDRMDEAGIDYKAAGENLAFAPNVQVAHEGLMNSPGHRENILRNEFGTLGVGVIDGGINGKMFCQEFTD